MEKADAITNFSKMCLRTALEVSLLTLSSILAEFPTNQLK